MRFFTIFLYAVFILVCVSGDLFASDHAWYDLTQYLPQNQQVQNKALQDAAHEVQMDKIAKPHPAIHTQNSQQNHSKPGSTIPVNLKSPELLFVYFDIHS